uniref:gamma-glutamyl hydrolase 2-like isoform X2 n=1 Tax=Erigeron canadensis TaxID=72917 RepID=UPI001CB8DB3D|nr:gamma-glutamyl hydrolase 2-like isoform X2 [Erigeron canadensis]
MTDVNPKGNLGPIIGIVSHPSDGASGRLNDDSHVSYIAASYVKFVESAGARVIPLIYNEPPEILQTKLNLINGVLFTGGWAKKGLYTEVVEAIFKHVLKRNDAGDHFPLFAICLGFELLTMIISKDDKILERFSGSHHASTLQLMKNISIEGTMFQRFSADLLGKLSTDRLVMHHHKYGISPERFQGNINLRNFFKILTTSTDKDNKVYVSTVQSHRYPVTAVQWHPEKNAFEWGLSMIPHSDDAVQVAQHFANFFVSRGYDEVYIFTENFARI